jgi:hypothetical protein
MDDRVLCGEKEICEWLKITPKQLRILRAQGLPVVKIVGHIWTETSTVTNWFRSRLKLEADQNSPRSSAPPPPETS